MQTSSGGNATTTKSTPAFGQEFGCRFIDFGQFDKETLTLLLSSDSQDGCSSLLQFPLSSIPASAYTPVNTTENVVSVVGLRTLDLAGLVQSRSTAQPLSNMKAGWMAVSLRKVVSVLSQSCKCIRLVMWEEDEADEHDRQDNQNKDDTADLSVMLPCSVNEMCVMEEVGQEVGDDKENTGM